MTLEVLCICPDLLTSDCEMAVFLVQRRKTAYGKNAFRESRLLFYIPHTSLVLVAMSANFYACTKVRNVF